MSRGRYPLIFGETPQSAAEGENFIVRMIPARVISPLWNRDNIEKHGVSTCHGTLT